MPFPFPEASARRAARCLFFSTCVAVSGASGAALADPVPSLDLRGYEPPTHPEGIGSLEPTATPGAGEWNVGAWVSYAHRSVVVEGAFGRVSSPVLHQLSVDYVGSVGLGERIGVGLSVPSVMYQSGDDPPPSTGAGDVPAVALGNVAASARATLIPQGSLGGIGLAALARVDFPTGNRSSYLGESAFRGSLRMLAELGVLGSSLRVSAGARVRSEERTFAGQTYGHDLPWAAGLVVKPQAFGIDREGRWLWALEAHGALAVTPRFAAIEQSPGALVLAVRRAFGDASVVLGAELPLSGAQGVPIVRAIFGIGYAPRTPDIDSDGIGDELDQCAELAEDLDGFEDSDGCPDFDNDGDGVPDPDDRCPRALEDLDDNADQDGCVDPDDDRDGVLDTLDACPKQPGPPTNEPKTNGCPARDRDMDGIPSPSDRCANRAEDRDGWEDADGCPDPDDDKDGVNDAADACPRSAGRAGSDPALNGCPSPDRDGDTYDDAEDRCPEAQERFDGVADEDGCPDASLGENVRPALADLSPARPPAAGRFVLRLSRPIEFEGKTAEARLTPASLPVLRAIAALLNAQPELILMVAIRPDANNAEAEQRALTRSFVVVESLRTLTHRDEAAESIGWAAVARVRGATQASGIGFLVLAPLSPSAAPTKAKP
jgi:OmpA-OmpF porin, OOP family